MRKRQLIEGSILLTVILGLLMFIIFRDTDKIRYDLPVLEEISVEAIDRIAIEQGEGDNLTLVQRDGQWFIDEINRKADSFKAGQLLELIANANPVDLITEKGDGSNYGLGEDDARVISLYSGDDLKRQLIVGKTTSSGGYSFIRLPGNTAVYTCRGNLDSLIPVTANDIRDMNVLEFDPADVSAVSIRRNDRQIDLQLDFADDGTRTWNRTNGEPFDDQLMESLLSKASGLRAAEYSDSVLPADDVIRIDFVPVGSWLEIHGKGERQYSCRSSDSRDPFMVSAYMAESFIGSFFPPDDSR